MQAWSLSSIHSRARQRAPAMALMEVLIAAAILAAATILFLRLLADARFDLRRAEHDSEAVALAQSLLQQAPHTWTTAPTNGETDGMSWTRQCALSPFIKSPRLALLQCRVSVHRGNGATLTLSSAYAVPTASLLRP